MAELPRNSDAAPKGKDVPGEMPLKDAGAALSNPDSSCAFKSSKESSGTLKGFPSESEVFAAGGKNCAETKGPEFPLKGPYDPEKNYLAADGKLNQRGQELQTEAQKLVDAAVKSDGSLGLKDHGKILDTIAQQPNLSESDKWFLYKQVCAIESKGRDANGVLIPGSKQPRVLFSTDQPTGLPTSGKGDVVRHIIIDPTNDSYHGGLVYGSRSLRAGYQRGEAGIKFHEEIEKPLFNWWRGEGFGTNQGDEQASFRQLEALRAMQNEGFKGYSRVWNDKFAK